MTEAGTLRNGQASPPGLGPVRITTRFLRYRWDHVLLISLLAGVLGVVVAGTASVRDSAAAALEESLRADLGGREHAIQTSDPALITELAQIPSAAPVLDDLAEIHHGGRSAPVLLRSSDDPDLHLGVLELGTRPARPGEALVSREVAAALELAPGDVAMVQESTGAHEVEIVGLVRDPADSRARSVLLLTSSAEARLATRWLFSGPEVTARDSVRALLDSRAGTIQSVDSLVEAALAQPPSFLAALRFLPLGLGLLVLLVLAGGVWNLGRTWARDVEALTAPGIPPRRGWAMLGGGMLLVAASAAGAGTLLVLVVLQLNRTVLAHRVGQDWTQISVPRAAVLVSVGSVILLGLLAPVARRLPWRRVAALRAVLDRTQPVSLRIAWVVLLVGAVLLISASVAIDSVGEGAALLVVGAALLIAACLPFVVAPLTLLGLPPARRSLTRRLSRSLAPIVAATTLGVVGAATWTAQTTYLANGMEAAANPMLPAGSFVIAQVPDSLLPTLSGRYSEYGGTEVTTYGTVDEQHEQVRVVMPTMAACSEREGLLLDLPPGCWPPPESTLAAPINVVMLGPAGAAREADPGLIEDGRVGLAVISSEDREGRVHETAALEVAPGDGLGGLLPGLILATDDPAVTDLGLEPAGSSLVVLRDFSELAPTDQYEMRGFILRLVPGTQVADGTDPSSYDRQRSAATLVSLVGGGLASGILLVGGMVQILGDRVTRRTIRDLAPHAGTVRGTAGRWAALPVASLLLTLPVAWAAASFGGRAGAASYGWMWILPALLTTSTVLVLYAAFLRVPARHDD